MILLKGGGLYLQSSRISDNWLRAVKFKKPDWIPVSVVVQPYTWITHGSELEEIILKHRSLFPDHAEGDWAKKTLPPDKRYLEGKFIDNWGCEWTNSKTGLPGEVTRVPIETWEKLSTYNPPDPVLLGDFYIITDWEERSLSASDRKKKGVLDVVSLSGGLILSRLARIRGFENLYSDIEKSKKQLELLVTMIEDYSTKLTEKLLEVGVDALMFRDDLGLLSSFGSTGSDFFRRLIRPSYSNVFSTVRKRGGITHFFPEGRFLYFLDYLLECGIDVLCADTSTTPTEHLKEIQEWVCIDCLIGSETIDSHRPWEYRSFIMRIVKELSQEKGGLLLTVECPPDIDLTRFEILMKVLEEVGGPYLESIDVS